MSFKEYASKNYVLEKLASLGSPVTSWNDLTDKPFGDERKIYEWVAGKEYLTVGESVKLSDDTPDKSAFIGGKIGFEAIFEGETRYQEIPIEEEGIYEPAPGAFVVMEAIIVVTADSFENDGLTKGIWSVDFSQLDAPFARVSITINGSLKTIEDKFIPDTIARIEDVQTMIDGFATEDYVQEQIATIPESANPDWNQNDETAADYVKNRTHYEEGSQTVIEWDGNTEGRDSFTANWLNDNATYYKVSDDVPAADDLVGGSVSMVFDGTTVQRPIESVDMLKQGNGAYSLEGMVVFVRNTTFDFADASINNGADVITAPSCGVYIVDRSVAEITSITYGSTTVHQLDEKFIPDTIARISDVQAMIDAAGGSGGGGLSRDEVQTMIYEALGVIENGTY